MNNPLIAAINAADTTAVNQLLASHPNLASLADAHGNTPLHHAAATHDLAVINKLLRLPGCDVTAKNLYGDTAADWLRGYTRGVLVWNEHERVVQLFPELISDVNKYEEFKPLLGVTAARALRYPGGETLLHMAVQRGQTESVKLLLEDLSPQATIEWLAIRNGQGATPLQIAETRMQSEQPAAAEIFDYLRQQLTAAESAPTSSTQQLTDLVPPALTKPAAVTALTEKLAKPIDAQDFPQLRPCLPTLVQVGYLMCHQALRALTANDRSTQRQRVYQMLLTQLFGKPLEDITAELRRKIEAIANYLASMLWDNLEERLELLSSESPDRKGWSWPAMHKIFLNPTKVTNLICLLTTLIHEASHCINDDHDFAKNAAATPENNGYAINFDSSALLAVEKIESSISAGDKGDVLITQQLLENQSLPLFRWAALNNADSIAIATIGLAALRNNCAEMDPKRHIIKIDGRLVSPDYVTHYETTPETPVPRPKRRIFRLRRRLTAAAKPLGTPELPAASEELMPPIPGSPTLSTASTSASETDRASTPSSNETAKKDKNWFRRLLPCTSEEYHSDDNAEDQQWGCPTQRPLSTKSADTGYGSLLRNSQFYLSIDEAVDDSATSQVDKLKQTAVAVADTTGPSTSDTLYAGDQENPGGHLVFSGCRRPSD